MNDELLTPEDLAPMQEETQAPEIASPAQEYDPQEFDKTIRGLGYVPVAEAQQFQQPAGMDSDPYGVYEDHRVIEAQQAAAQAQAMARQALALQQLPQVVKQYAGDSAEAAQELQEWLGGLVQQGASPEMLLRDPAIKKAAEAIAENTRSKTMAQRITAESKKLSQAGDTGQQGATDSALTAAVNAIGDGAKLTKDERKQLMQMMQKNGGY